MKTILLLAISLASLAAHAARPVTIKSGRFDAATNSLVFEVSHGGGFVKEHQYKLELGGCLESMPVQCGATLIDLTRDGAEALLHRTVTISLKDAGLDDEYFKGASLTVSGEEGTRAQITLP